MKHATCNLPPTVLPADRAEKRKKLLKTTATTYASVAAAAAAVLLLLLLLPRSGELRTQKLKSRLVRTQSLNVLPLKSGVGRYIAIHATLTARNFFLVYFYPSGPFTCIFAKTSSTFFLCWLWLTLDPV